ncbi:MAG: cytochrome c [Chloroflexi bacterium]|nr:cytochrome c [Chloroflexota bacterium]
MSKHTISMRLLAALAGFLLLAAGCGGGSGSDGLNSSQVARGRAIYVASCQQCHGEAATGEGRAPNAPPHSVEGHTWHHADGLLVGVVLGTFQYPGREMPSFGGVLTEAQVLDVVAYFKTNWGKDQLDFQAEASRNWEAQQR